MGPWATAEEGAPLVKTMLWDPLPTEYTCVTAGAAKKLTVSPSCVAVMVHEPPAAVCDTTEPLTEPLMVQTLPETASVTGSPEEAVAVTVYDVPTTAAAGAVEVMVILWAAAATADTTVMSWSWSAGL